MLREEEGKKMGANNEKLEVEELWGEQEREYNLLKSTKLLYLYMFCLTLLVKVAPRYAIVSECSTHMKSILSIEINNIKPIRILKVTFAQTIRRDSVLCFFSLYINQ